jgi:hypothetical protein
MKRREKEGMFTESAGTMPGFNTVGRGKFPDI